MNLTVEHTANSFNGEYGTKTYWMGVHPPVIIDGALYIRRDGELVELYAKGKWTKVSVEQF